MVEIGIPVSQRMQRLSGCRVLVVEDDFFLADDLTAALRNLGAAVIGPASSFQDGLLLMIAGGRIDVALLDINLRGEMAYPLADILLDRGVEVVLATGYDRSAVPERFAGVRRVEKPFDATAVARDLSGMMRPSRPGHRTAPQADAPEAWSASPAVPPLPVMCRRPGGPGAS